MSGRGAPNPNLPANPYNLTDSNYEYTPLATIIDTLEQQLKNLELRVSMLELQHMRHEQRTNRPHRSSE